MSICCTSEVQSATEIKLLWIFLLVAFISLQSAFASADTCSSSNINLYNVEFSYLSNTFLVKKAVNSSLVDVGEECFDCMFCPCCSNVMFSLAALQAPLDSSKSFLFSFESTRFDAPYYSFLRPPKS